MRAIVVGAGISGCVAARILQDKRFHVTVFETESSPGGQLQDSCRHGRRYLTNLTEECLAFLGRFTVLEPVERDVRLIGGLEHFRNKLFCRQADTDWCARHPFPILESGMSFLPHTGYADMFTGMLDGIDVRYNQASGVWRAHAEHADIVVYTGRLDALFHFKAGPLPYLVVDALVENSTMDPVEFLLGNEVTAIRTSTGDGKLVTECTRLSVDRRAAAHSPGCDWAYQHEKYAAMCAHRDDRIYLFGPLAAYCPHSTGRCMSKIFSCLRREKPCQ